MGYAAKNVSDHSHKELSAEEIYDIFLHTFVDVKTPLDITECHFQQENGITATISSIKNGENPKQLLPETDV